MKKFISCILLSISILILIIGGAGDQNVDAAISVNGYNVFGLGKTVNVATDSYLDYVTINKSKNLFDTSWLNSRLKSINLVNDSNQHSSIEDSSSNSVEDLTLRFSQNHNLQMSINGELYNLFAATIKNSFNFSTDFSCSNYKYQFFYNYIGYYPRYFCNLAANDNKALYIDNLSQNYQGYLNLLFRGAITPKIFFDTYGTHVITEGVYGGRFNYSYFTLNNKKVLTSDMRTSFHNAITSEITSKIAGTSGTSFDFKTEMDYSNLIFKEGQTLNARGGAAAGVTSKENLNSQINTWLASLDDENSALIDISEQGLIPLWDLLPEHYMDKKAWFKNECLEYFIDNSVNFSKYNFNYNFGDTYTHNDFVSIRKDELTIDSDNEGKNSHDYVDLNLLTEYGYDVLKEENYKKAKIEIQMSLREQNHGYQHIYLYNDNNSKIAECKYELGKDDLIDGYEKRTFIFDNIDLNSLIHGNLYIRYGSSGIYPNKWLCKDIKVKVTYSK